MDIYNSLINFGKKANMKDDRKSVDLLSLYSVFMQEAQYQDKLRWSRFANISAIEGAMLILKTSSFIINDSLDTVLFTLGSLLVFFISLTACKDMHDMQCCHDKLRFIENLLIQKDDSLIDLFKVKETFLPKGRQIMILILLIINGFNIFNLVLLLFCR